MIRILVLASLIFLSARGLRADDLPYGADGLLYLVQNSTSIFSVKLSTKQADNQNLGVRVEIVPDQIFKGPEIRLFSAANVTEGVHVAAGDLIFFREERKDAPDAAAEADLTKRSGTLTSGKYGLVHGGTEVEEAVAAFLKSDTELDREAWAIHYFGNQNPFLFRSAVLVLQAIPPKRLKPETVQTLIGHVRSSERPFEAEGVVELLARIGTADCFGVLKEVASDPKKAPVVRESALRAMMYLPDGFALVVQWRDSPDIDPVLKEMAKKTAARAVDLVPAWTEETENKLKLQLFGGSESDRLAAIKELKRYTVSSPPVKMLAAAVSDSKQTLLVRTDALDAIAAWKKYTSAVTYNALAREVELPPELRLRALLRLSENSDVRLKIELLQKLAGDLETEDLRQIAKGYLK